MKYFLNIRKNDGNIISRVVNVTTSNDMNVLLDRAHSITSNSDVIRDNIICVTVNNDSGCEIAKYMTKLGEKLSNLYRVKIYFKEVKVPHYEEFTVKALSYGDAIENACVMAMETLGYWFSDIYVDHYDIKKVGD